MISTSEVRWKYYTLASLETATEGRATYISIHLRLGADSLGGDDRAIRS